jgi:SAM-dependent methyltransferase
MWEPEDRVSFDDFALAQLPPPPSRVLEVGCGEEGGIAPTLAEAGYDVLAIDPDAPDGPFYRRVTLEQLEDPEPFDAAAAGRVLHHVHPLGPALDKLATLAPVVVIDEFAWNHMDRATIEWYENRHRELRAAGQEPKAPPVFPEWLARHPDLHPYETLRRELDSRYEPRYFQRRPYLYRWLRDSATRSLEEAAIAAGAIQPIGWRYAGVRRETVRSSADAR